MPGPVGGGAEVIGCGRQPCPGHGGPGAAVLEGFWHSGCDDPGTQVTEVGGGVLGAGNWQSGSGDPGVHDGGWALADAVSDAAAALRASVAPSRTTRLTARAQPRVRRGSHRNRRRGRIPARPAMLAEHGEGITRRPVVGAGREGVGSSVRWGRIGGVWGVPGCAGLVVGIG
ncbi:MAG: hypothetical protein ACRDR6_26890 [Pseudonocardiaceae bacterium]